MHIIYGTNFLEHQKFGQAKQSNHKTVNNQEKDCKRQQLENILLLIWKII
jgi:hypothetical protein